MHLLCSSCVTEIPLTNTVIEAALPSTKKKKKKKPPLIRVFFFPLFSTQGRGRGCPPKSLFSLLAPLRLAPPFHFCIAAPHDCYCTSLYIFTHRKLRQATRTIPPPPPPPPEKKARLRRPAREEERTPLPLCFSKSLAIRNTQRQRKERERPHPTEGEEAGLGCQSRSTQLACHGFSFRSASIWIALAIAPLHLASPEGTSKTLNESIHHAPMLSSNNEDLKR